MKSFGYMDGTIGLAGDFPLDGPAVPDMTVLGPGAASPLTIAPATTIHPIAATVTTAANSGAAPAVSDTMAADAQGGGASCFVTTSASGVQPGSTLTGNAAVAYAPLVITPTFNASITSLGSGTKADPTTMAEVEAGIQAAINYYDNSWTSSVPVGTVINGTTITTVNVNLAFNYGNNGAVFGGSAFSQYGLTDITSNDGFTGVVAALGTLLPNLPAKDPTGGGVFLETNAQIQLLGLGLAAGGPAGSVFLNTIANGTTLDWDLNNQSKAGEVGAVGAIEHEMTEIFGRISDLGSIASNTYSIMDLYRFSAPGVPALTAGPADYFSINGGTTALGYFNNVGSLGGDTGDWASSGTHNVVADSYDAFLTTGTAGTISNLDSIVLSSIGFRQAPVTGPRTMVWTGSPSGSFLSPANWNDVTNKLSPAQTAPNAADTAEFLTGGGTITDSGTVSALQFGGGASWNLTAGGTLNATASVTVGQGGSGALLINAGARINGQGFSDTINGTAGLFGSVSVDGAGSAWNSSGELVVGDTGTGGISLTNGGTLTAALGGALPAMVLGASAGGNGALSVSGAGSLATLLGQLNVGQVGDGMLAVSNQGTVRTGNVPVLDPAQGLDIAQKNGASGEVTVSGNKSLLANIGRFVVGDAGLGSLSIAAGATVTTAPGTGSALPGAVIANAAGANGSSVNVSGAGSNWRVSGLLDVGLTGAGELSLSSGATVTAGALDGAVGAAAVANISVAGAGTDLAVIGDATVADDGTGVLSVLSGATFSAASLTIGSQGDSSGALVVSGSGSVVQLSGDLNVGTSQGTGDLTVGPGAAVHASVVSLQGQVVLEGGLLDPTVNVINQGQTAGGFGTLAAGFIIDEGLIQAGGSKPAQKLLLVQGTIVGGGTLSKNNVAQPSATGVIQINAGGTIELTGAVVNAATTTFTDNLTPTGTYSVTNSVIDVSFADAAGVLLLDDIAQFGGTIAAFKAGDSFVITGGTLSNVGVSNGNTLTFSDSGTGARTGGVDQIIFGSAVNAGQFNIVNNNTVRVVPCFAEGTRIGTAGGMIRVEEISVGDRAITVDGRREPILWIGQRRVDCTRHPRPGTVWPVRVAAGAFGENVPARDVYLSPDHAVFVNDVLVPVKLLINGTSIVQVERAAVTYYHVELARHDVILAEGLAVESYLDLGHRADFGDAGGTIRLFPDFAARLTPDTARVWETRAVAPLVVAGPLLAAARRAVTERGGRSSATDIAGTIAERHAGAG